MGYDQTNLKDIILSWFKGTTFTAAPTTLYVGLYTANPADDSAAGTEVSTSDWTNYARQPITCATGFSAISGTVPRKITNGSSIDFGTATIATTARVVTGMGIWSASTNGTRYAWSALGASKTIANGDSASFGVGALEIDQ